MKKMLSGIIPFLLLCQWLAAAPDSLPPFRPHALKLDLQPVTDGGLGIDYEYQYSPQLSLVVTSGMWVHSFAQKGTERSEYRQTTTVTRLIYSPETAPQSFTINDRPAPLADFCPSTTAQLGIGNRLYLNTGRFRWFAQASANLYYLYRYRVAETATLLDENTSVTVTPGIWWQPSTENTVTQSRWAFERTVTAAPGRAVMGTSAEVGFRASVHPKCLVEARFGGGLNFRNDPSAYSTRGMKRRYAQAALLIGYRW